MTSRERVVRTLEFNRPDRVPRDLWRLAGVNMFRQEEVNEVLEAFPCDFAGPAGGYGESKCAKGNRAEVGTYVDEWGCEWSVAEPGVAGEVKSAILDDWSRLEDWQPPWELLDNADMSGVKAFCAATDKFVKAGTHVRPFERMQFLRGTENLFMDMAMMSPEFCELRDRIHAFNLRDIELWAATDVDAIGFMDDWGTQKSLLISPELWRTIFKPMYSEYCQLIKDSGKYVFFHSDGYTMSIIPDLIEIGVDALNTQIFCMNIEELAQKFKGAVTFWGEIDRQGLLPFGTPEEIKEAVRRVRRALDDGAGGAVAQCEWGNSDPKDNIMAVFEAWEEPRETL